MWGSKPWDNDQAADWFGYLMENSQLPVILRETLMMHKKDNGDGEINSALRAALFCMVQFCRVYVWPIDDLDTDLALAIQVAEQILSDKEYCSDDEIRIDVENSLEELKSRLAT